MNTPATERAVFPQGAFGRKRPGIRLCHHRRLDCSHGDFRHCDRPWGLLLCVLDGCQTSGHAHDKSGALFRPTRNNRTGELERALTGDAIYKLVRVYAQKLGLAIGAHALRATAATNALENEADIAQVPEWLGHANIATTRIYDRRRSRPQDSPTFKVSY